MSERRGRLLLGGKLVPGRVVFERGTIQRVETEPDARDAASLPVVAPGFVDLHVHGFGGCDPSEDLEGMARALARVGTTAFQPTLFPADPRALGEQCATLERAMRALPPTCARAVGLHLEGPFVNPERAGALPRRDLAAPSREALRSILGPASGSGRGVRTMTLAPELPGAADLIDELARCGIRASLGHSLATAADARAAARAGARGATHLFNAMGPLHHREVGLAGFALSSAALHAELIGDLVHVSAEAIAIALRARGAAGLCLVSDSLPGSGSGCDVFHWHGREHRQEGGAWYRAAAGALEEPQLSGSALPQIEMVRRLAKSGAVSLEEALTMAAETPARALSLEREHGLLAPGARADLVVLEGPDLALAEVLVGGA